LIYTGPVAGISVGIAAGGGWTLIPATGPLILDIHGLTNGDQVQGVQHIEVAIASGQARSVELLVDNSSRGISRTLPFTFDWDSRKETPGPHKVVLRAIDGAGRTSDKELLVKVVVSAPAPTLVPPVTAPSSVADSNGPSLAAATLAGVTILLLLCGVGLYLLKRGSGNVPTLVAAPVATELVDDKNGSVRDSTAVSARRTQLGPKARVLIKPDREIDLSRTAATSIGRDASNAVVLDDKQVSRHHARITYDRGDFWIEDLHSTNGTRVNGQPIGQQKLANYDQIELGDVMLTFSVETN